MTFTVPFEVAWLPYRGKLRTRTTDELCLRMNHAKKMKLAYLSGPVDAADVYARWKVGRHTQLFGTSYLMQFYELCAELDADALVITTLPGSRSCLQIDNVIIENRPPSQAKGMLYHLSMILGMVALLPSLARFGPTAFIITAHQNYWFMLAFVKLLGTEIIPSAHCVLWRPYTANSLHLRLLLRLDGLFLKLFVSRALAISQVVADQLRFLAGNKRLDVLIVTPTYSKDHFRNIGAPNHTERPFRVLFNGRAEANKGIFDLLEVASQLNCERPREFLFDVCGEGSDLPRLQSEVDERGLREVFRVHGFCNQLKLGEFLDRSHVVVVPTRSDFEEGLAKSCVEAVLAGRPFVSSQVCPAMLALRPAGVEVAPDHVAGYHAAIVKLADDPAFYKKKVVACLPLQAQFYDDSRSYKSVLKKQLRSTALFNPATV